MNRFYALVCAALLGCAAAAAAPGGSFSLKAFESYNFADGKIGKSGSGADISFFYQVRRMGMISFLGASKIKDFESEPKSLSAREVETWDDSVAGPAPGWYVIRTPSGKHYLLKLESFENQGKAASYWKMNFTWKEIQVR